MSSGSSASVGTGFNQTTARNSTGSVVAVTGSGFNVTYASDPTLMIGSNNGAAYQQMLPSCTNVGRKNRVSGARHALRLVNGALKNLPGGPGSASAVALGGFTVASENPVLKINDFFTRKECLEAIAVWGTKENVPEVIAFVTDSNVFLRHAAMNALAKIQDERGIEPIAQRLTDFGDCSQASEALQAFGRKAEKEVARYLKKGDWRSSSGPPTISASRLRSTTSRPDSSLSPKSAPTLPLDAVLQDPPLSPRRRTNEARA